MRKERILVITTIAVIGAIGIIVAYVVLTSRQLSPPGTARVSYNGLDVVVDYHRPSKRGRVIFGDSTTGALQPNGRYWRLGANEATEISFSRDVTFAGNPLDAGRYRMYAVPNELTWTLYINTQLHQWGFNEPDHSQDLFDVGVVIQRLPAPVEQFTINFDTAAGIVNMHFIWDQARVTVPIRKFE